MLLGMSPPTPKERRQGNRQVMTPKQASRTKLKASPPAQHSGAPTPSPRRRSLGAPSASLGQLGDLARKMNAMGAVPAKPASRLKPKLMAKKCRASPPAPDATCRKSALQLCGAGTVLVAAHSASPQAGVELSPPVSEIDSQSDGNSTADEPEQHSPLQQEGEESCLPKPVAANRTRGRGGRLRVNRLVTEGRELAAAEATEVPSAAAAVAPCVSVDLPHVDPGHPLEQAWARQTNSRYDGLRSLKLEHGILHAPGGVGWATDAVTAGAWQHLGGKYERTAREGFCSEMLAPHGHTQGSVSCPPGLVQVAQPGMTAAALRKPLLTSDQIAGLLAGPCARMQKLHSSMTRISYRALYPRTGHALAAEQETRRMDKAIAIVQLLWPRSAARQALLRRRQERAGSPGGTPRASAPRSPPAPDLWEPEKRSTIDALKTIKDRRLLRAREAGLKAKAEGAKKGVTFKRTQEADLQRIAQEEAEWRSRQASKHPSGDSQKVVDGYGPSDQEDGDGQIQGCAHGTARRARRKYQGASAGESPLAAAARVLLARAAPEQRGPAGVEICAGCGLAGSQLGRVDSATGRWLCQHCGLRSSTSTSDSKQERDRERRGSTGDFSGPSSMEATTGNKRRPLVRRRPQSAALHRSTTSSAGVAAQLQLQLPPQFPSSKDDLDYTRWCFGRNAAGGSPKSASELSFETRMRMVEMLGGSDGGTDEESSAQQAQAAALARTLMHRGLSRPHAEAAAARTVQSTRQSMKTQVQMPMRPQSASAVRAAGRSHGTASRHEEELEAVMLEAVGVLTAERGFIAEQLAWAHKAGASAGAAGLLAERMQTAERAVDAATRVLAKPRSDRSIVEAQEAGGAMIKAAQELRQQVASCRHEQFDR